MKIIPIVLAAVIGMTLPALADYQKGSHSLALSLGSAGFGEDVDVNNGDNRLDDEGGAGGLQYLWLKAPAQVLPVRLESAWIFF